MYKNTPKTYFMGGATPTDMAMINRGVFFMGGADTSTQDWKGKPADWSDIRKDCPANSIALYAGQGSIYTKVGNPTIENGIVSNFSGSDFIKISAFNRSSFKQIFKIRTSSSFVAYAGLWQENASTSYKSKIFFSNTGKVIINLSSDGSSFDIANNLTSTVGLQTETDYYILFAYENGEYSLKYSSDGENFNNLITPIVSSSVLREQESIIGYNSSNNRAFNGEFDLNESYNEVNGQYLVSTQYDNLGFTATCTGGYNVFIDGTQHGTTYASGATCTITWSTSGITTGDIITTPSLMKAHKIWIEPATEGNDITRFQFKRVSGSVQEEQGCLWCHFNLNTSINLQRFSAEQNTVWQKLCEAITAKNNTIKFLQYGTGWLLRGMPNIKYIPVLDCNNTDAYFNYMASNLTNLKSITVKNANVVSADDAFSESISIENIKFVNVDTSSCSSLSEMFRNNRSLRQLPDLDFSSSTVAFNFLTNATALEDTILNISSATALERIGCYGTSTYFMSGFKGLRVSNQAPFSGSAPQINVSYTGMDRTALVTLFNDLPTVSDGQIINITGCTGSENLTDEDISIAENKGWTVAGGPAFQVYATYSGASVGDTIKLNDGMATSAQVWSAYPSDTALTGDYTQTKTVTAVDGDLLECEKPTQDNKIVDINTGLVYYAYTNGSNQSVYAVDNPISESPNPSTLYDSSFQELNPQPEFNVLQQGLVNATEYGTLTNNNGVYSGFSSSNFLYINTSTPQTLMDFIIKCNPSTGFGDLLRTQPDGKGILLRCSSGSVLCYLSSTGSGWNTLSGFNTGISMSANTDIYVRITWNSTNGVYTFWQSTDGETWTERNSSSGGLAAPYWSGGNQTIGACSSYSEHWYGSVDMKETKLIIDGNTTNFYNINSAIIIDNVNYIRNSANDLVQEIPSDIEIVDNTTINNITITSDQTATIETSTNITSLNNNMAITDGSYYLFNITTPPSLNTYLQANGANLTSSEMPLLIKKDSGIGLLLKNGNTAYYRKSFIIDRNYDLHYQQINFSYPSGATVTCKVNNVLQNDLTPYCYVGDTITWSCDNAGTVTTGSYTVQYSSKDGNIQTITIS